MGIFCLVNFLDSGDSTQTARILHYVFAILWPPYIRFGGLHYIAKVHIAGLSTGVSAASPTGRSLVVGDGGNGSSLVVGDGGNGLTDRSCCGRW